MCTADAIECLSLQDPYRVVKSYDSVCTKANPLVLGCIGVCNGFCRLGFYYGLWRLLLRGYSHK